MRQNLRNTDIWFLANFFLGHLCDFQLHMCIRKVWSCMKPSLADLKMIIWLNHDCGARKFAQPWDLLWFLSAWFLPYNFQLHAYKVESYYTWNPSEFEKDNLTRSQLRCNEICATLRPCSFCLIFLHGGYWCNFQPHACTSKVESRTKP